MADSLNHRVQLFSRDGTFLHAFGRKGRSAGEFDMPGGVAVGTVGAAAAAAADGRGRPPDTHIVVTDQGNGRVQLFERDGTHVGSPADLPASARLPPLAEAEARLRGKRVAAKLRRTTALGGAQLDTFPCDDSASCGVASR